MHIFGTSSCNSWCENCVTTSEKLKIRTNYCQSVLDCFVSIACDWCHCSWPIGRAWLTNQSRPWYNHGCLTERDQLIRVQLGLCNVILRELSSTFDLGSAEPRSWTTLVQRAVNVTESKTSPLFAEMHCKHSDTIKRLVSNRLLRCYSNPESTKTDTVFPMMFGQVDDGKKMWTYGWCKSQSVSHLPQIQDIAPHQHSSITTNNRKFYP